MEALFTPRQRRWPASCLLFQQGQDEIQRLQRLIRTPHNSKKDFSSRYRVWQNVCNDVCENGFRNIWPLSVHWSNESAWRKNVAQAYVKSKCFARRGMSMCCYCKSCKNFEYKRKLVFSFSYAVRFIKCIHHGRLQWGVGKTSFWSPKKYGLKTKIDKKPEVSSLIPIN